MDEYDSRTIDLNDGAVALHSAITDRVVIMGPNDHGGFARQSFSRDEAERLAVWLRCRLDKPQPRQPDLTPAKRNGVWDLSVHAISCPPNYSGVESLIRYVSGELGVTFHGGMDMDRHRARVTFRRCTGVPLTLPSWIDASKVGDEAHG